jgi:hypothetical protein
MANHGGVDAMIRVSVHLISAIDHSVTELARMDICNDGTGSFQKRNYDGHAFVFDGVSYIGRNSAALDRSTPSKIGRVVNWPSQRWHIWNLVRQMLTNMGYTNGEPASPTGK